MTVEPQAEPERAEDRYRRDAGRETLAMLMGIFEAARLIPTGMRTDRSLPLTIISGFLGAGKTTLVNRLLAEPHGRRLAVLVNDFGAINIDEELIRSRSEDTIGLTNGCACCSVSGELTRALLGLLQRPDPPDAIVLEASGLADPHGIAQIALANPAIRLDGVLTLVDAETFLDRVEDAETAPLVRSQLMAADLVVINKVDLVGEGKDRVHTRLVEIAGQRAIVEAVQSDISIDVVLGIDAKRPSGFQCATEAHAVSFSNWTGSWDSPLAREPVMAALRGLPPHVIRAKGVFVFGDDPAHRVVYQRVGQRESYEREAAVSLPQSSHLVLIGASASWDGEAIGQAFAAVTGG